MTKAQANSITGNLLGVVRKGLDNAKVAFANHPGGPPHKNNTVIIDTIILRNKFNGKTLDLVDVVTKLNEHTNSGANFLDDVSKYKLDYDESSKTLTVEPK